MVGQVHQVHRVQSATALTRSGMKDWLVQRVSAILMLVYLVLLAGLLACHWPLSYSTWLHVFSMEWFKISTLIFILCLMLHAWIGVWTIFTDYIHCSLARGVLQILVLLALFSCALWSIWVIWG